jgi:tetratricopeptide (TPR) repeat protein
MDRRPMMKRTLVIVATGLAAGAALFLATAIGGADPGDDQATAVSPIAVTGDAEPHIPASGSLDDLIASLQTRLQNLPTDHVSWATLGLAYVQQAKLTVDPTYYPKADGALAKSLEIDDDDNFLAYAGLSALASARHDFALARTQAQRGLEINPYSAILYGALSDAELQMGNYDQAFAAVQKMVDLSPDAASLARASYTWELRGDTDRARALMQRALDDAPTPADSAFALVQLGGLAFEEGDANGALQRYNAALSAFPADVAALAGKAKSEAALGQTQTAIDDYETLVERAPEPSYIIEYGRLLESAGRHDEAQQQYTVFAATQQLFAANGVEPDASATLFYADQGDSVKALDDAQAGIERRPFVVMYDAQAWALHMAGRDDEALVAIDRAMELGTKSALFHFHAGMIANSLGDIERARSELTAALTINPAFDPLSSVVAAQTLASLPAAP